MPRKALMVVLATLILSAGLAGGLYWRWSHSPRYALQQMVLALKTRNMDKFFNYLDLKDIFNNVLDASSKDLPIPDDKEKEGDDWSRFSQRLGRKFARHFLPKLFETFGKQIRAGMELYLQNLEDSQILALAALVTVAQIEVQGEEAQVTLHDPKTKHLLRFQMRCQADGIWRIVAVNYQDLKSFLQREFRE